jgi:hypothetical protein
MANSFSFMIPYIDKMIQQVPFEKFAPLTTFETDVLPDGGLTGRIPRVPTKTASAFTAQMYRDSGDSGTVSGINFQVDQIYESNFQLKYDEAISIGSRRDEFISAQVQQCVRAVLKAIESGFFASGLVGSLYKPGSSNIVGTAGTAPFATPWADYVNIVTALNRNLCPDGDRVGIVDAAAWAALIGSTGLFRFDAAGPSNEQTLRSALAGRLFDIMTVYDTLVPTFNGSTTGDTGYFVISGALSSGVTSGYVFMSGGDTGARVPGDIFWISGLDGVSHSGYGQSYVVTSGWAPGETGAGQASKMNFYPALRGSATTLARLTFLTGTRRQNIFGHKSAVRLIMRDPARALADLPQNGQHFRYVEPRTQIPLDLVFYPGDGMVTVAVKAYWSWVNPWPEWTCILAG